jgi:hypothetical protein
MSPFGPKLTWASALHMSAFGGKADPVEGLRLTVDDHAAYFNDDLSGKRLRAVFASPFYY